MSDIHMETVAVINGIFLLVVAGLQFWTQYALLRMSRKADINNATIKLLINIVIVAVAILLVLSEFGVWDEVRNIKVPEL